MDRVCNTIYVADFAAGRIQKLDLNGNFISAFSSPSGDHHYSGVAVDEVNGFLFAIDLDSVEKYDLDGNLIASWGSQGPDPGQFGIPAGIAVDQAGSVYVTDPGLGRIQKFDGDGNLINTLNGDGWHNGLQGIAVAANGDIYVADTINSRIQKRDSSTGTWSVLSYGRSIAGDPGYFQTPQGVALNSSGDLLVVDADLQAMQKLTGNTWSVITSPDFGR